MSGMSSPTAVMQRSIRSGSTSAEVASTGTARCDHKATVCFDVYARFKVGATGDVAAWMQEVEMPAVSAAQDGVCIEGSISFL